MQPNRLGLGLRPPLPSFGQGPSMSALAQQQQIQYGHLKKTATLFVGSISGGIQDPFLTDLLTACGPVVSFKRLITPANKPQGFGFAEFEDADGALRAIELLSGVELPALEDGCANKKLLIKPDEKTRAYLDAYASQKMKTDVDEAMLNECRGRVQALVDKINKISEDAAENGLIDKEKYVIPPHLHDLQEADLPEMQRGLVISEIAQFRERAAKREREKLRESATTPSGPKFREWGKPQPAAPTPKQGFGQGAQGYNKPVNFVKEETRKTKTDEELEEDRKLNRRKDEENSFLDRERRYEPRERTRIGAIERAITRERQAREAEERDRVEMRQRLDAWDDDESDELFYVDRARWRQLRGRRLEAEEAADAKSRRFEETEVENLKRESEDFLARQMDEMQALADEQRKAGLLLDDGAPVRLNVSIVPAAKEKESEGKEKEKVTVFVHDEEEEEAARKRKLPLVKLDFSVDESAEQTQARLEKIRESVPQDKETLFKSKVRWDGLTDATIDRKFDSLVKRLMTKYLGELDDDDLIMFVLEHLKDHKGPQKLVEGIEPVLEEDAAELVTGVWRQVIFESIAYGEGILTEKMMVD